MNSLAAIILSLVMAVPIKPPVQLMSEMSQKYAQIKAIAKLCGPDDSSKRADEAHKKMIDLVLKRKWSNLNRAVQVQEWVRQTSNRIVFRVKFAIQYKRFTKAHICGVGKIKAIEWADRMEDILRTLKLQGTA